MYGRRPQRRVLFPVLGVAFLEVGGLFALLILGLLVF